MMPENATFCVCLTCTEEKHLDNFIQKLVTDKMLDIDKSMDSGPKRKYINKRMITKHLTHPEAPFYIVINLEFSPHLSFPSVPLC